MKTIKYLLWLIILGVLGLLIYQNIDYFMTTTALSLDLKIKTWSWTLPGLQTIAYLGICFFLGLILAGLKGLGVKFRLQREMKKKDVTIDALKKEINTVKEKLDVFTHDPYIKKNLEEKRIGEDPLPEKPANDTTEGGTSDTAD